MAACSPSTHRSTVRRPDSRSWRRRAQGLGLDGSVVAPSSACDSLRSRTRGPGWGAMRVWHRVCAAGGSHPACDGCGGRSGYATGAAPRPTGTPPAAPDHPGDEEGRMAVVGGEIPDRVTVTQHRCDLGGLEVDEIDATSGPVVHHRPGGHPPGGRMPVQHLPEPQKTQGRAGLWFVLVEFQQHQIQVVVPSGLMADQGVDTPSAPDDAGYPGTLQRLEDPQDIPLPHVRGMEPGPSPTQERGQRRCSDDPSEGPHQGQKRTMGPDPLFEPVQGSTGQSARRRLATGGCWLRHCVVASLTSGPSGPGRTDRSRCWSIDSSPRDL
jgi:hypothetical protein